jgi:hypothetical protein
MQMQNAIIRVQVNIAVPVRRDTLAMDTHVLTLMAALEIRALQALTAPMLLHQAKDSRVTSAQMGWST